MKKLLIILCLLMMLGCSKHKVEIEDCTWVGYSVQDHDGNVIAYGKEIKDNDENIPQVELTCVLDNEKIDIHYGDILFTGNYRLEALRSESVVYDIILNYDTYTGITSISKINEKKKKTLVISNDVYTFYFYEA